MKTLDLPADLFQPHALQPCWDNLLAGLSADALRVALELGLFSYLQDLTSAEALAERLSLNPAVTAYLLELLWSAELLERQSAPDTRYRNRPLASRYLASASADYCGDTLLFRHQRLRQIGTQLGDWIKGQSAVSPDTSKQPEGWAKAARLQIRQEQRAVTAPVAGEICAHLPEFAKARRLLDLGGGPGLIAIRLAQMQPALSGVVFDYPETATVAREQISEAGLSERLQALGGDLERDDFGAGYDLIWCSSVLHFAFDIPALLTRLYQALNPGGVLIACHAELAPEAEQAKRTLHYYLALRLQGRAVWPQGQLAEALKQAGFTQIQQHDGIRSTLAPLSLALAYKK